MKIPLWIPGYEKFRMYTWNDKFWLFAAAHMPRKLRYWAVINAGSFTSTSEEFSNLAPDQITLLQILHIEAVRDGMK